MDGIPISAVLPGLAAAATDDAAMAGGLPGAQFIGSMLSSVGIDPSLIVKVGVTITILASVFGFLSNAWEGIVRVSKFFSDNLVSSATIRSTDESYVYVMKWLYKNNVSTDSRLFGVTTRKNQLNPNFPVYTRWYGVDGMVETESDGVQVIEDELGPRLKYTAAPGFYHFFYKKRLVLVQRKLKDDYYGFEEPDVDLTLFTFGRSPKTIRALLEEARVDYLKEQKSYTLIHTTVSSYPPSWSLGHPRPSRKLDSVIMKETDKDRLLKDMQSYLAPSAKKWYHKHGLPYRRGYLFYGMPGSGKTSLTMALAGELGLPIYCLSLSSNILADDTLLGLFTTLPKRCIILLEDIDSAGIDRMSLQMGGMYAAALRGNTDDEDEVIDAEEIKKREEKRKLEALKSSSVSLSGLLNAIDGISSHEGRILIMTTNYRELLDKALIRPGRVDMEIYFGKADIELLEGLFKMVYADPEDTPDFIHNSSTLTPEELKQKHTVKLSKLAHEFGSRVPSNKFTPAEVQGFLLSHRADPEAAIDHLGDWLKTKLEELDLSEQAELKAKERLERAAQRKVRELEKKNRDRIRSERKELEEIEQEEKDRAEKKAKEEKEAKEKAEKEKNGGDKKEEEKKDAPATNGDIKKDEPVINGIKEKNKEVEKETKLVNGVSADDDKKPPVVSIPEQSTPIPA